MDGITPENFDDFINHIYDKIFKLFFKHKPVAVDCLTHFVAKDIVDRLDLELMTLKDTNFISKDLQEYYSDVIYETYLNMSEAELLKYDPDSANKYQKKRARVVLIWEHKYGIESYFKLFVQILNYKVQQYLLDILENREPTLVIPIIVNQGERSLKNKNFHDSFKHVPQELLKFVENFECFIINVHDIKHDVLLKMKEENLLRALFLAYQAVQNNAEKKDALLEIFKFIKNKNYFAPFFQPLLAFIIKKGTFSETNVKQMLDNFLTPQQKQDKMVARLSLGDKWEAIGEARGEARGEKKHARLSVLRGLFRGQHTDLLADICGLPLNEVLILRTGYEVVKKEWQAKNGNMTTLSTSTTLSQEEIKYILTCLDSMSIA
jgi:hypothetical protein